MLVKDALFLPMNRGKELVAFPDLRGLRTFGALDFTFVLNSQFS